MAIAFDLTPGSGYTRTTVTSLSSNASMLIVKPSAVVEGELLLAVLHAGNITTANDFTPPAGFTEVFNNETVNIGTTQACHTLACWKIATASEPADYTFGLVGNTRDDQLTLYRVTGVSPTSPIAVLPGAPTGGSSTSPSCPSVTTVNANDLAIFIVGQANGAVMTAEDTGQPTGTDLVFSKRTRNNSNGTITGIATQLMPTPGATGAKVWSSYVTSANRYTGISFALRAFVAGSPTISSIGTASVVHVGQVENIATTNLGTLTSAVVGGKAAASINAPGGSGTITLGSFVDGEIYPAMGTVTTTIGNGSITASKVDCTLNTMPGWQWVNVSNLDTSEFSVGKAFGGSDLPTQLHLINDGTGVLNTNGTLTNWATGTYTCWARMAAGTWPAGTMKSFTFTVYAPIVSGDLSVAVEFSSPLVTPEVLITPDDWVISTEVSQPVISQVVVVNPDDLVVSVGFDSAPIEQVSMVYPDDMVVSVSFSLPVIGSNYSGPFVSSHIVQVISSKLIVLIAK